MTKEEKLEKKRKKQEEKQRWNALSPEEKKAEKEQKRAKALKAYEAYEQEHAEMIAKKKEEREQQSGWKKFWFRFSQLSFFQAFRKWWKKFSFLHPVGAKWIYQIFYFIVFSEGVTIWQYLVMLFLPNAFGIELARQSFVWPEIPLWTWDDGTKMIFGIFNEPMKNAAGQITYVASEAAIGGGLGNFIAFEIAVFTAQVINFPLQRNITFRSKGNVYWQAMWYFVGWVLISIFVNAVWGFVNPILAHFEIAKALTDLLKTFITGGLSMVIFFFIFKIIFPEGEAKKEETVKE